MMLDYPIPTPPENFSLRPITPDDMDYLKWLYGTTRTDVDQAPWTQEQKNNFIAMQFNAQHQHYQTHYPQVGYYVIQQGDTLIGRIYIDWTRDDAIHLMEITLNPPLRKQGIGTLFMRWLMDEAVHRKQRVTLYVEDFNPAYQLYTRLGFKPINLHGIYTYMEWTPNE